MLRLFHVSDDGPFTTMRPRPSPPTSNHAGREWVWAVDEPHLPHYFLPRDCPRVCWATAGRGPGLLTSPATRVVAVEHAWAERLTGAALTVHELDPAGFTVIDANAGYWVSDHDATVTAVRRVDDCLAAFAEYDVELRLTGSLWPYMDAVVAAGGEFSGIRMRNAQPRAASN